MNPQKILIIDNDMHRAKELKTLFDSIEHPSNTALHSNWQRHGIAVNDLLGIVLGDCADAETFVNLVTMLHECYPLVPLLLIGDHHDQLLLKDEYQPKIIEKIALPITQETLKKITLACIHYQEKQAVLAMKNHHRDSHLFRNLVGLSSVIRHARQYMEKILDEPGHIYIHGEENTGKEVWARNLHYFSTRRGYAFVAINCKSIPADALQVELFGNVPGHHWGQATAYPGCLELANGGTLFINDIELLPAESQQKLAAALQQKTTQRIGSQDTTALNLRLVIASSKDLKQAAQEGTFNRELLNQTNGFFLEMPPLRARTEDLPLLLCEIADRLESELGKTLRFTPETMKALQAYSWPGNLKELTTLARTLLAEYDGATIELKHLPEKIILAYHNSPHAETGLQDPASITMPPKGVNLKEYLAQTEIVIIQQALKQCEGVITHAAKLLHMRRTTLVEKMRKYGLRSDATFKE